MNIILCSGDQIQGQEIILLEGKKIEMEDKKPTLLLTPKGSISTTDKAKLSNKGYIVIEVDDPSKVKTIADLGFIGTDIISIAAIETLNHDSTSASAKESFGRRLLARAFSQITNNSK